MEQNERSSVSNPLKLLLHINGPREGGDRPRDVGQVIMRLVCETDNGALIEGHKLVRGENFAMIYEDRIPHVMKRVRTADHLDAMKTAKRMADNETAAWIKERMQGFVGTENERKTYIEQLGKRCPIHWAQKLSSLGYHSGIPPLSEAEIVVKDLPAPVTPENATKRAHEEIARAQTEGNAALIEALKAIAAAAGDRRNQKG
jgi:hypothetical protein